MTPKGWTLTDCNDNQHLHLPTYPEKVFHPNKEVGKNFKNVCNWCSFCTKNNASIKISSNFNIADMFSKYVWCVHNVETLLKLFSGIWGRQLRTLFVMFTQMQMLPHFKSGLQPSDFICLFIWSGIGFFHRLLPFDVSEARNLKLFCFTGQRL